MREIKFRVWDHSDKKWSGSVNLSHPEFIGMTVMYFNHTNRLEYQQFTGLKDKDNKEIYEGDILKAVKIKDESVYFIGECKFENNRECGSTNVLGFWFVGEKMTLSFFQSHFPYFDFEIIGNIFENPELLKS